MSNPTQPWKSDSWRRQAASHAPREETQTRVGLALGAGAETRGMRRHPNGGRRSLHTIRGGGWLALAVAMSA
jgi:hypothetical protein